MSLASRMDELRRNARALNDLRQSCQSRVLSKATIIGCTTVSAAKLRGLLREVGPQVVLVEEAGEIFEAQVLTNLSEKCQQLIMIGDHKQLPPKAECFRLRKESGNGFNLDISLFERLVCSFQSIDSVGNSRLPFVTLSVQHRMRPEISRLIRETMYPGLADHESTLKRGNVRGVAKNVVFIDHRKEEMNDEEAAVLGSNSKVNVHEVQMVVGIAEYLLQQTNISAHQIAILTPYLGQLAQIRKALSSKRVNTILNELDRGDLARLDLDDSGGTRHADCHSLRAATIDNFQGEEADIIIISLVRSNKDGDIGFLSSDQRVNVLLSRARMGMYIVGNLETLGNSRSSRGRQLWRKIKSLLEDEGNIMDFFPVRCEKHKLVERIRDPSDFTSLARHGGCSIACGGLLQCGHPCPLLCHPNESKVHEYQPCKVLVPDFCQHGHNIQRECRGGEIPKCMRSVSWVCHRGHTLSGECCNGRVKDCKICDQLDAIEKAAEAEECSRLDTLEACELELEEARTKLQVEGKKRAKEKKIAEMKEETRLIKEHLGIGLRESYEKADEEKMHSEIGPKASEAHSVSTKAHGYEPSQYSEKASASVGPAAAFETTKIEPFLDAAVPECRDDRYLDLHSAVAQSNNVKKEIMSRKPKEQPGGTLAELQDHDLTDDSDLRKLLDTYNKKGAVSADTVLYSILQDRVCSGTGSRMPKSLEAFRFILQRELDPNGLNELGEMEVVHVRTLPEMICCFAQVLDMRQRCPYQAQKFTQQIKSCPKVILDLFPKKWMSILESGSQPENPSKVAEPSTAKSDWEKILQKDPEAPLVMTEVMEMVGIEHVKKAMIRTYHRVKLAIAQKDGTASTYNVRFEGNPGTGKTTIARHYGTFLKHLMILPKGSIFIETSGATLNHKGIKFLEEELQKVKDAGGAVIFIDEAYQLMSDRNGKLVLDFIIPLAESIKTDYGMLVWILAGYTKDMEKLFEHNVGLPSRFPTRFSFEDYSDADLTSIFKFLLANKPKESAISKNSDSPRAKRSIQMPNRSYSGAYSGSYFQGPSGSTKKDRFDNIWTWNGNAWQDPFGNITGYGPENVGSAGNPLIAKDGSSWIYDDVTSTWQNNSGVQKERYPGKPVTQKAQSTARETPFRCEDEKWIRIAMRRLGRQRGRAGFGNARAVRVFFDQVRDRQATRIKQEQDLGKKADIFLLKREDLLGQPISAESFKRSDAYQELQNLEGLAPVKKSIDDFLTLVIQNVRREEREQPILDVTINRVFLGNPGTGKTTVAKIYGKLLTQLGLLSKGEVILKNPSDFVGDVLGSSEKLTRDILKAAEGCVLVIDEAYSLYSGSDVSKNNDPYKSAVIDTIVEQVQAKPGDDRAVVLLGYKEEMERMFKNVNPGLSRRFQLENALYFPDYDDASLIRILMAKVRKDGLEINLQVAKKAVTSLGKARAKPHFGNAGAVDNLLSQAKLTMQQRGDVNLLTYADFGLSLEEMNVEAGKEIFNDMVGMDDIQEKLLALGNTVLFAQNRGEDPKERICFNYLFVGNPGTGKTTVARKMGKLFMALDLLPSDEVHEISASDLVTGYVGQSGKMTRDTLQKSRGGVLFIDEAYQLNPMRGGSFMTEVVDEIVKGLTSPEFQGKMLVILAGYEADMDAMLSVNPGLKSRFAEKIHFHDITAEAAANLMVQRMKGCDLPVRDEDHGGLLELARRLVKLPDFGNGRDVDTWSKMAYTEVSKAASKGALKGKGPVQVRNHVSLQELSDSLEKMAQKKALNTSGNSQSCAKISRNLTEEACDVKSDQRSPKATATAVKTVPQAEQEDPEDINEKKDVSESGGPHLFQGIDAKVLSRLQAFLNENGLNSESGVAHLSRLSETDAEFQDLVSRLVQDLGMTPEFATQQLKGWQKAHKNLQEELRKQKEKLAGATVEAIWRCAVCGQADKPWIACYVAPYIVCYRPVAKS